MTTSRRMRRRTVSTAAVVIAAAGLVAGGMAASAHWSAGGSGSGAATAATTAPVIISPGVPSATLVPGGRSAVVLIVSNTNRAPVRLGSLALDTARGTGGFAVDAAHSGCSVASLGFETQTNAGAGWTVPARVGSTNGSLTITLPSALAMSASAGNACQGSTATVFLSAAP